MHRDADTLGPKEQIKADVCIVGAGAAGIVLALELANKGKQVLLLEGGGLSFEPESQDLYSGGLAIETKKETLFQDDKYLKTSRLRFFGGSTNHWANYTRPLDPIDFEKRSWVPNSGWPISRSDLDPYYERAYPICGVSPIQEQKELDSLRGSMRPYTVGSGKTIETQMYHFATPATNFATKFGQSVREHTNITLVTHANAVRFHFKNGAMTSLTALNSKRSRLTFSASTFVLAMGGIENARLLLANRPHLPRTFSSTHVGRFFMEHPHIDFGRTLISDRTKADWDLYNVYKIKEQFGVFTLAEQVQRDEQLLNIQIDLDPWEEKDNKDENARIRSWNRVFGNGVPDSLYARVRFILEQPPQAESRLVLGAKTDTLGLPQVQVKSRMGDIDWKSMKVFLNLLSKELGGHFAGRVNPYLKSATTPPDFAKRFQLFGNHHVGTTRMHEDPKQGVVDANTKAHGTENLYVAGSSVFTTGGHAPPTLTIVAMTLRLAEHLEKAS